MNREPMILITKPKKQLIEKDNLEIEINNYDNSHLYYKGFDLGTFKEIVNLRQENQHLKERINKVLNKIDNMFDRVDANTIIDDLLELDKILKGSDSDE